MYLVHPHRPELNQEIVSFDKERHVLVGRLADGRLLTDPNFHIDIAKRCGFELTPHRPAKFKDHQQ